MKIIFEMLSSCTTKKGKQIVTNKIYFKRATFGGQVMPKDAATFCQNHTKNVYLRAIHEALTISCCKYVMTLQNVTHNEMGCHLANL